MPFFIFPTCVNLGYRIKIYACIVFNRDNLVAITVCIKPAILKKYLPRIYLNYVNLSY